MANRSPMLGAITAPTCVIHGEADPLVPLPAAHDLVRKIVNAVVDIIPGMGHDLPLQLLPAFYTAGIADKRRALKRSVGASAPAQRKPPQSPPASSAAVAGSGTEVTALIDVISANTLLKLLQRRSPRCCRKSGRRRDTRTRQTMAVRAGRCCLTPSA